MDVHGMSGHKTYSLGCFLVPEIEESPKSRSGLRVDPLADSSEKSKNKSLASRKR